MPLLQYPFIEQSEHIVDSTEQKLDMSVGQVIVPEYPVTENTCVPVLVQVIVAAPTVITTVPAEHVA